MSSEEVPAAGPGPIVPRMVETGTDPADRRLVVNDPKVMRALAHPLRWSILEALLHAGTLTATQAGEILGETPANCAFHLRTLARYGLVEEAGGGKGRERPWRRVVTTFTLHPDQQDDPQAAAAAGVLDEFWTQRSLDRARSSLMNRHAWPEDLKTKLVSSTGIRYLTPGEAHELSEELGEVLGRFRERNDDPAARPAGAIPVEFMIMGFPVMDLLGRPAQPGEPDEAGPGNDQS